MLLGVKILHPRHSPTRSNPQPSCEPSHWSMPFETDSRMLRCAFQRFFLGIAAWHKLLKFRKFWQLTSSLVAWLMISVILFLDCKDEKIVSPKIVVLKVFAKMSKVLQVSHTWIQYTFPYFFLQVQSCGCYTRGFHIHIPSHTSGPTRFFFRIVSKVVVNHGLSKRHGGTWCEGVQRNRKNTVRKTTEPQ